MLLYDRLQLQDHHTSPQCSGCTTPKASGFILKYLRLDNQWQMVTFMKWHGTIKHDRQVRGNITAAVRKRVQWVLDKICSVRLT